MTKYSVFLENVPSVNHIHGRSWLNINCQHCGKFVKKVPGFMFTTTEGKNFLEYASLLLKTRIPLRDFTGKLVVEAFAHWPDRRARDMNNYAKFIADALQLGGIVANDKTVLWREIDYKLDPGVQGFELTIYPLEVDYAATQTEAFPKPAKVPKMPKAKPKAIRRGSVSEMLGSETI